MKWKVSLTDEEELVLSRFMNEYGYKYKAEACRALLVMGKTSEIEQEQIDKISMIVKEEMDNALQSHNTRIKSILYKGGKLASYSTYLLIGALRELIPVGKKKNLELLYEKATKYAMDEIRKKEE